MYGWILYANLLLKIVPQYSQDSFVLTGKFENLLPKRI